jgi:hypothetical protein
MLNQIVLQEALASVVSNAPCCHARRFLWLVAPSRPVTCIHTINGVCVIRKSSPIRSTKSSKVISITANERVRGISFEQLRPSQNILDLLRNEPKVGMCSA